MKKKQYGLLVRLKRDLGILQFLSEKQSNMAQCIKFIHRAMFDCFF